MAARGSSGSDRSVFSRLKSRLIYRNVFPSLPSSATSSGSVTSTAHSSDSRPMQVVPRVVEEDYRALSDAQIEWTVKGLPQYRSLWEPYKQWCLQNGRFVFTCASFESFHFDFASAQVAEFLSLRALTDHVKVVSTLGNYRSCICSALETIFSCKPLADSKRISQVMKGFGKEHPAQPRCRRAAAP